MRIDEFKRLQSRVVRSHAAVHSNASRGFEKQQVDEAGNVSTIDIRGIKSLEQLEDEILNLLIWIWSMKEYLKQRCQDLGVEPTQIEDLVNSDPALPIAADVASRAKHGCLKNSRCGSFAKHDNVAIVVPQQALNSIAFLDATLRVPG